MHPEYKKFFGDANDTAVYEDVLKRHSSVVMEALGEFRERSCVILRVRAQALMGKGVKFK